MSIPRTALCITYGLVALVALIGTWGNNLDYFGSGFVETNLMFWRDTLATPASRSITVDILFLGVAVAVWMLLEARRLNMRGAWLYIVFGLLIAISVTVPLFLIHRERVLAKADASSPAGRLTALDVIGLVILGAAATLYTNTTLTGL